MTATPPGPPALEGLHHLLRPMEPARHDRADVVVHGATSAGVAAAIAAAERGLEVVLLAYGDHVGGLSTGGLGTTDVGHGDAVGGLARRFYAEVARVLGHGHQRWPGLHFNVLPDVAEDILLRWLTEAGVRIVRRSRLQRAVVHDTQVHRLESDDGSTYEARVFIDASYEGDLMAAAGVSHTIGRESRAEYGEGHAGVWRSTNHQFHTRVDPYRTAGQPDSGLLPGVTSANWGAEGEGDNRVQAYTFRLAITPGGRPYPRPDGYDPDRYALLLRYLDTGVFDLYGRTTRVHGSVFDMNNHGAVSSDHIGASDAWPAADHATREKIFQDHVRYQAGMLHFLATDPRVPGALRELTSAFGLSPGHFRSTSHWPHQLYIREGRRMVGSYVVTEHDALGRTRCPDPIALASYVLDAHNARRVVVDGAAVNEGNIQVRVPQPFGISYRAIVPKPTETRNLLVPAAASASHVAYSSIRMEPVFMAVGEAAGAAAAAALDAGCAVGDIDTHVLATELSEAGARLRWPLAGEQPEPAR